MTSRCFGRAAAWSLIVIAAGCATVPPVAAPTAPRYPDYPVPVVPADLTVAEPVRVRHEAAWQRLQAGDLRGASRAFLDLLRTDPEFFPAETGLGYVLMAQRNPEEAAERFAAAAERRDSYLPAWLGLADARLATGADDGAILAFEKILQIDPQRSDMRARLELMRFKQLPALIEGGQRARREGRYDEARAVLQRALALSPTSPLILRELAQVDLEAGALADAEAQARKALAADDRDAESHAILGAVLAERGDLTRAADEFDRAVAIDPRPDWKVRADGLRSKVDLAVIPPEFRAVPTAASVTRAQVAAYIGIRLERLLARAPQRTTEVATDVRNHWASPWILPITRAGVMEILPNHTFEPATPVRRGDLARIVAQLLTLIPQRQMDLARWRAARPRFADLPATNIFYTAAAMAVSAGAMTADPSDRFAATRPASGPDLVAAIARVEDIAGR